MDLQQSLKETFAIEAECLAHAVEYINEADFSKAVELLASAVRTGAAGCGHSGIACQHFTHLMCCIERPARFISPAEAIHGATGYLQAALIEVTGYRNEQFALIHPGGAVGERLNRR